MAFGLEIKRLREEVPISAQKLADRIGINADRLRKWEEKDLTPRIEDVQAIESFFGMDIEQVMKLKSIKKFLIVPHETEAPEPPVSYFKTRQRLKNGQSAEIPVFTGNTRAGIIEVYSDDPTANTPIAHLPANIFPGCNHAEKVSGDSMHPVLINQGYAVGKIIDKKGIIYGEKYIIHTKYGLAMVKYLQEAGKKGFVKLVSYNKHIAPQEIPYDDITFCCRIYFIVNPS